MQNRLMRLILALAIMALGAPSWAAPKDVILVVDNSGSMRVNDPQFLNRTAMERIIRSAEPDTRIGIILFDTNARLVVPLDTVTDRSRPGMLATLDQLDYRGAWTDIPAAIELALYHFDQQGRADVPRNILFMTDGIIDTGDAARDRDRERWLLDDLLPAAVAAEIRIFGIAFSEGADFRLIQALAQRTDAQYIRAFTPESLLAAYDELISTLSRPTVVPEVTLPPAPTVAREPVPVLVAPAVTAPVVTPEPPPRRMSWLLGVLLLALLAAATFLALRYRRVVTGSVGMTDTAPPGAALIDLSQATGMEKHLLLTTVSVIGRMPAPGPDIATSVVIERKTVSRRHATISWHDDRYWIEDHGSQNGTFINGERLQGTTELTDGDRLRFDTFEFDFRELQSDVTRIRNAPEEEEGERTIARARAEQEVDPERTNFNIKPDP